MLKVKSLLTGHILRATYDWFLENNFRDILIVAHTQLVPDLSEVALKHAKEDHTITFNIHPRCAKNFYISDEYISFNVTVNGVGVSIKLPLYAVLGVVTPIDDNSNAFFEMPLVDRYLNADTIRATLEGTVNNVVDKNPVLTTVGNVTEVNFKNKADTANGKLVVRNTSDNEYDQMIESAINKVTEFSNPELDAHIRVAVTAIKQNAPELIMDWCERVINCTRNENYQDNINVLMMELLSYPISNVVSESTVDSGDDTSNSFDNDVNKMVEDFNNSSNSQVIINKPSRPTGTPKLTVIKGGKK
ncbi:hypothetical protein FOPPYZMZ_CDS0152 [Pseudomonas phage 9Ps-7B]|nr:hypothetical protein IPCDMZAV_CDS0064 [Pseudomonas phage 6B]WRQ06084.1 hypothetical protein QAMIJHJT_CDS0153 [Pseudomonas phage 9-Ps-8B]WRQ06492.1 hypothetical protein FOPPYZMZ_CDS0152 [Pseudomonas phage 9Ps-7B]WRQ06843.1 hypothetical protein ZBUARNPM_CDS0094 [Pseudomonas phage 14Ps5-6]